MTIHSCIDNQKVITKLDLKIASKDALLKERDATIEALRKKLKIYQNNVHGMKEDLRMIAEDYNRLEKDLAAERKRAEVYREVAISEIECGITFRREDHESVEQFFAEIKKYKAEKVDREARKLLAERSKEGKPVNKNLERDMEDYGPEVGGDQ